MDNKYSNTFIVSDNMVSDCFLLLNALKLILNFFLKIAAFLYIAQMNSAWPQYAMGL